MGGLFSTPKPPAPAPLPTPVDDTEEKDRRRRLARQERIRRGRRSTIATSNTGLLGLTDLAPQRRSLLGE